MIKHVWSVICAKSSIDNETNLISISEVLENLDLRDKVLGEDLKGVLEIKNEVVSCYFRDGEAKTAESVTQQIVVISPDGREIANNTTRVEFPIGIIRMRNRVKSDGMPVAGFGIHIYEVRLKNEVDEDFQTVARIPISVNELVEK
jgi:hypothetical protein